MTENKNYCDENTGHFNTGGEDCPINDMNSDRCHAYNNGKCMNGYVCPSDKQARAEAGEEKWSKK